ncbi:DUF3726 domain-containing protein [Sulfitobacter sp.]|uniref:DUF3726 domain-containing protein n=1 Tax=Sulfitobacter sp. TaxID=1903071 RepID=UPI0030014DD7
MTTAAHDQTRGGSTPCIKDGHSAALSRNEVASLCMKAARGAGMNWGLAEEAGFAAAWLVQHGINGPRHLFAHLDQAQGRPWSDLCPTVAHGAWQAPAGRALCPIALGATLCDYAGLPEGIKVGSSLQIGKVDHPVLLIPFLAGVAAATDMLFDIAWTGGSAGLDGGAEVLEQAVTALDGLQVPITLTARFGKPQTPKSVKAPNISAETVTALTSLAMRTTVPSSESSRAGAGSTTTDND